MPNFNNGRFIGECIESVLAQEYGNIELVIVDDKSDDNSVDVIKSINDKRISLVCLEKNLGVAKARNIGIEHSTGNYVTTLDSDDLFTSKKKLLKEFDLIRKHEREGRTVVAFSNIELVAETGDLLKTVGDHENIREGRIHAGLLHRTVFIPRDFLCHRVIYENVGLYDESLPLYEDWDIKIRISKHYEFYFSGISGIGYRTRKGGLSKVSPAMLARWRKHVYEKNSANGPG